MIHSRHILVGLLLVSLAAIAALGVAQEQGAKDAVPYRIGVVNMQRLMQEYDKRKAKYDELQTEVDELQKDVTTLKDKIEKAQEKLEKDGAKLTEEERFDLKNQLEDDITIYKTEFTQSQRLIDNKEERVMKEVLKDISATIEQLAEDGQFHLVLNSLSGPGGTVLYHSPTIDITSQVLAILNGGA